MYIHLGADVSIPLHTIVGIFDLDAIPADAIDTMNFMAEKENQGKLDLLVADIPRSLVVTVNRSYLSAVSAPTLRQRCSNYRYYEYEE